MNPTIQYRSFPLETKVDSVNREIEGYASTWNTIDVYRERVVKGAFKKSIKERFKQNLIKVLWQHREPLGVPIELREDETGLYTRSRISRTQLGDDALTLISDGVVDRMSIGFRIVRDDYNEDDDVLLLKELTLFEYSPVTFAANEDAVITAVRSLEEAFDRRLHSLEQRVLKDIEDAGEHLEHSDELDGEPLIILENAVAILRSDVLGVANDRKLGLAIASLEDVIRHHAPERSTREANGLHAPDDSTRETDFTAFMNELESLKNVARR